MAKLLENPPPEKITLAQATSGVVLDVPSGIWVAPTDVMYGHVPGYKVSSGVPIVKRHVPTWKGRVEFSASGIYTRVASILHDTGTAIACHTVILRKISICSMVLGLCGIPPEEKRKDVPFKPSFL